VGAASNAASGDTNVVPRRTKEALYAVRCLTVREPYASEIIFGGKDVENRSKRTSYRGPLVIHASQPDGCIVGIVQLIDCIPNSKSKWAQPGFWHWILEKPVALLPPIPMGGALGIYSREIELPIRLAKLGGLTPLACFMHEHCRSATSRMRLRATVLMTV